MKLLVTGSDGLVGSALQRLKQDETYFATREDADLTKFDETIDLFNEVKPTHVIHLAALVGGIGGNIMHSGTFFRDNILINTHVLEAARIFGAKKLISFMSTCVFPDGAPYPLSVENIHDGPPHPSNFAYAYAKRMLDVQTRAYRAQWMLDYSIVIPTNIYGPNDNWNLTEGHVIPSLIHRCFIAQLRKEPLVVWGSGRPLREFIYVDDIARLIIDLIGRPTSEHPLIISSGVETSIAELVGLVVESMDFKGEVIMDSSKPDGQFRKPSNVKPFNGLFPNFEFTSLKDGIISTVSWFRANHSTARM